MFVWAEFVDWLGRQAGHRRPSSNHVKTELNINTAYVFFFLGVKEQRKFC